MGKRRLGIFTVGLFTAAAGAALLLSGNDAAVAAENTGVLQTVILTLTPVDNTSPMGKNGGTHEQGVVTQYEKNGRQYITTVYMSPNVPDGEEYWQCKCSTFEVTEEGFKPIASDVQITHNVGGYRNCNRPAIAGFSDSEGVEGGVVITYGTDYMDPNTTSLWAGTLDEYCNWTQPEMMISNTPDNDNGGPDIAYLGYDDVSMKHRFMASSFENGGGGRAWGYTLEVGLDIDTNEQELNLTSRSVVYTNLNIARQSVEAIDYDRALYCGPYGNTRPPNMGVLCNIVDANDGDVLNEMLIAESKPNQDIYYNDPQVAALDYNRFAIKVNRSNGAGRKTNDKGASRSEVQFWEITDNNEFILKDQEKDLDAPFQTHAAMCSGMYGDPAKESAQSFALLTAPPTGVGQGMLHTMKWTAESGFSQADQWIISEVGDSGEQSNMYGANPNNQGRNFLNCIGNVENPGYGIDGAFMPTVKSFFVSTMSGKKPGEGKNSQFLSASPALHDPTGTQGPPSGSSGSGGTKGPGSSGSAGESSGACAMGDAGTSHNGTMAALVLLGLGLAAARRRREDA